MPRVLLPALALLTGGAQAAPLVMPAPDNSWSLQMPAADWAPFAATRRADGRQHHFLYRSRNDPHLHFSVTIEPVGACASAQACADYYAGKFRNMPAGVSASSFTQSRHGDFVVLNWQMRDTRDGASGEELNASAETVVKGCWVDMHFSYYPSSNPTADADRLNTFIDGVRIRDGASSAPLPKFDISPASVPLGDDHKLNFDAPAHWQAKMQRIPGQAITRLDIRPDYGDSFVLRLTAFGNAPLHNAPPLSQQLHTVVDPLKVEVDRTAVKPGILQSRNGSHGLQMLYFEDEEKGWSARPGSYRYQLQGSAGDGSLTLSYTLLYNDPALPEKALVLDMIGSSSVQ